MAWQCTHLGSYTAESYFTTQKLASVLKALETLGECCAETVEALDLLGDWYTGRVSWPGTEARHQELSIMMRYNFIFRFFMALNFNARQNYTFGGCVTPQGNGRTGNARHSPR